MLQNLPVEILLQIISQLPKPTQRSLKCTSRQLYILLNTFHKHQFHKNLLTPQQYKQIKGSLNQLLKPFKHKTEALYDLTFPEPPLWEIISSLVTNRKIYFNPKTFIIQSDAPSQDYEFDPLTKALKIHKCQSFFWLYTVYLSPSTDYQWSLRLKNHTNSRGLGTTSFRIEFSNDVQLHFPPIAMYPPTYICDILPPNVISVLNLGRFTTPGLPPKSTRRRGTEKLIPVHIVMEEVGMFPKMNLELYDIEFKAVTDQWDYLYYSINEDLSLSDEELEFDSLTSSLEREFYLNLEWSISSIFNLVHLKPTIGTTILPGSSDSSMTHSTNKSLLKIGTSTGNLDKETVKGLWEWYYTKGQRKVKMLNIAQQREFEEWHKRSISTGFESEIRHWKLPFTLSI